METQSSPADHSAKHGIHVVRHGGLMQAMGVIVGLFMFGCVFLFGLGVGAMFVAAGSLFQDGVVSELYRDGSSDGGTIPDI